MSIELATSITFLLNSVKNIKELGEKERYAEVMKGIADMSIKLSEMTISAQAIQDENTSLKEEIKRLKTVSEKKLVFKNGLYYDENESAFCPDCYENRKELTRMSTGYPMNNLLVCKKCKLEVEV